MARAMDPDSAGSQFFIMVEKAPHLDGSYAAFGRIIEGMEAADTIVNQKRNMIGDNPGLYAHHFRLSSENLVSRINRAVTLIK